MSSSPALPTPIFAREAAHYADVFDAVAAYRSFSPGLEYLPVFLEQVGAQRGTLLDAGCGTGRAGLKLSELGFDVTLFDCTDAGLDPEARGLRFEQGNLWGKLPRPPRWVLYDYAYCCDVLEHIPTAFAMLVVANLLRSVYRGVFLSIALTPDAFGAWTGRPLHLTVQNFSWWRDNLRELGRVREARDFLTTGIYYVEPR